MSTLKIGLTLLFCAIWFFFTEYIFMPAFSFGASTGIYFNLLFLSIILALIWAKWDDEEAGPVSRTFIVTACAMIVVLIIGGFASSELFNTDDYQKQIGKIEETEFTANVQPIATNQMLIVDEEGAKRIGEKELGSDPGLGSRAELGKFTLQAVKGQLYWIAPLEHSGFWKWKKFSEVGTPGYVRVSATNQDDHALITNVDGKDLHIKYQTQGRFGEDLDRHIYTSGYRSILYKDETFEVDDNWHPYWTVTVYDTKIAFAGSEVTGVLTIDPETGHVDHYNINDAPSWIDRIQPIDIVKSQIENWGAYVHGYGNWSDEDKLKVAGESSLVLGHDGRSYFYFGITSHGEDDATVGFIMVDTRTKKVHWFKQKGATEDAAKKSAEGKVQEKGYVGSDGITYNIDGHPTYEFLLKDKGGLMKLIALVNVEDHTKVGIGENRQEAIQDYRSLITNHGNTTAYSTSDMTPVILTSKISRFASETTKGNTYYLFVLEKNPKLLFTASTSTSYKIPLTKEGDWVKVSYVEINSVGPVSIMSFDNFNVGILTDSIQLKNEVRTDSLVQKKIDEKSGKVIDNKIENLTPEEKRELLKLLNKK